MKSIKLAVAALVLCGMAACCCNEPKTFTGFITDATMNTVTVKALTEEATSTFSTDEADMSQANGLLLGSPVVVDYKGKLQAEVTPATKVATDPTYAEAIGSWTISDPIAPDSVMGIQIMVEGAAQSINMASLRYSAWELQGETGKIVLKGVSEGSGDPIEFTQTATIAKSAEGAYTLAIDDTDVVLNKVNQ